MRKKRNVLLVSGLLAATLLVGTPARAATITVTTTVDEWDAGGGGGERSSDLGSDCGLREAIHAAEVNAAFGGCPAGAPGHDEIVVPAGTYPLNVIPNGTEESAGDLNIASDVTITGAGPSQSIIDAVRLDAVMEITNTAVTLEGLTLRNGYAITAAGLYTDSSVVVLRNVAVRDNEAGMNTGGGIYAFESDLTILDSTISGNRAASQGGGIASFDSELSLDGVALSDNFVQGPNADGGGILALASSLTAVNTTLSGNRAPDDGGGIYIETTNVSLRNATLTKNVADEDADNSGNGGGIENVDGTVTVANSIVAENEDRTQSVGEGRDCSGNLTSQGYNVIGYNGDCTFTPATGDQVGTAFPENLLDPELGPLTDNGGPTETHALLPGSPALDNGSPERTSELRACEPTDQRGVPRPQGTGCDVGAYELGFCVGVLINRVGFDGAGTITGTEQADGMLGHPGSDDFDGMGGDDAICSGGGDDTASGGDGDDTILGEDGNDRLSGDDGNDQITSGAGNDRAGGGGGKDRILGEKGNDKLRGQGGKDLLKGQQGKDKLNGGGGKDRLVGGPKKDTCNGGPGKDKAAGCSKERKIP